jgi:hypothetical protein
MTSMQSMSSCNRACRRWTWICSRSPANPTNRCPIPR